jgi:hypothetical protein
VRRGLVHEQITPLHTDMNEFAQPFGDVRYELQLTSMTGRVLVPPAIRYGQCTNPVETPRYAIITCCNNIHCLQANYHMSSAH